MSSLNTQQLLLLNNLMYLDTPSVASSSQDARTSYEGRTVADFINHINEKTVSCDFIKNDEWRDMLDAIKSDETLMQMEIRSPQLDAATGDKRCVFVNPETNEAVVTFKGTGQNEWKDNFIAGNNGDPDCLSPQQESALEYLDSLNLDQYSSVTTTGHSKGGNKAKLCALMNGEVDECVSFDGQGFSDDFMEKYADEIARNQHKIENHNAEYDYVNLLLNDIGKTEYYDVRNADNFIENHAPNAMFDNMCNMRRVDGQPIEMKKLDEFLNSYLRSMDPEQRADSLDFIGEIAQAAIGDKDMDTVLHDLVLNPRYKDEAAYLLAYVVAYEHETGELTGSLYYLMDEIGIEKWRPLVTLVNDIMYGDDTYAKVREFIRNGEEVPGWLILAIAGISDLTVSEVLYILDLAREVDSKINDITIAPDNGGDIRIPSEGYQVVEIPSVVRPGVEVSDDQIPSRLPPITDLLGSIIYVNFAELRAAAEELQRAIELYASASEEARSAADILSESWLGAARDAFVADQQRLFAWYEEMAAIARAIASVASSSNTNYQSAEARLSALFQS